MIVLDTNVVSELMRTEPDSTVVSWLDAEAADDVFITAVTAAELVFGLERMPHGARRQRLASAIGDMLEFDFADRILPFDAHAALEYGTVVAGRERLGRPIGMADAMIVATALSADAALVATRNTRDFADTGIALFDPWHAGRA